MERFIYMQEKQYLPANTHNQVNGAADNIVSIKRAAT